MVAAGAATCRPSHAGWRGAVEEASHRRRAPARLHGPTFFERPAVPAEEAVDSRRREALSMLGLEPLGDLGDLVERDVHGLRDHGEDSRIERFDPAGALVAALRARREAARLAPEAVPLHRRRGCDAEPGGRRRQLWPESIASTTRRRRSRERGWVMKAGLLTSLHDESRPGPNGNLLPRFRAVAK